VQAFQERDVDAIADLVRDDFAEEYTQSGERIRGKHNYLSVFENIPAMPSVLDYRFTLCGDLHSREDFRVWWQPFLQHRHIRDGGREGQESQAMLRRTL
jgi:ketosteroid isomerase-like protein